VHAPEVHQVLSVSMPVFRILEKVMVSDCCTHLCSTFCTMTSHIVQRNPRLPPHMHCYPPQVMLISSSQEKFPTQIMCNCIRYTVSSVKSCARPDCYCVKQRVLWYAKYGSNIIDILYHNLKNMPMVKYICHYH
jgi:hypothetical protein